MYKSIKIKFIKDEKSLNQDFLRVSVDPKHEEEIEREGKVRTFKLKCEKEMTLRKLFLLVRKMVLSAKNSRIKKVAFNFSDFNFNNLKLSDAELGEIIGMELDFANYEYLEYKDQKKNPSKLITDIVVIGASKEAQKGIQKGQIIAEEVNKTRTLANTPGGDMTPKILARKARESVKGLPVKVTILGEKQMKQKGMHAVLAVGKGSDEESQFIIMEYMGGKKGEKPIVMVGKGVTFDSGGINLKPSSGLLGMNMDMSGGASAVHAIALVAKMKLKKNVVALIPSVENMAGGGSYRPGDVIRSMSGQTIEVLNTDAEGRVIMADALYYSQKYKPEVVLDMATLTGAAVVALGEKASAIFTKEDKLAKQFEELAEKTGEYVWRLPLWDEYEAEIKGSLGDWTNVHNKDSRWGGAIYAAMFLYQFIKGHKWVHFDIAPRMTSTTGDNLSAGAVGAPVRLLYKFIEEYKKN